MNHMETNKQISKLFDAAMEDILQGNFDSVRNTCQGMIYRIGGCEVEFELADCDFGAYATMNVSFSTSDLDDMGIEELHKRDYPKMREYWKKHLETKIEQLQRELKSYE